MYFVYVLRSLVHSDYYYKGMCSDLSARIKEHNDGKTVSNKHFKPFEVAYFEVFTSVSDARKREKYWKTAAGRRYLQPILRRNPTVVFTKDGPVVQWIE